MRDHIQQTTQALEATWGDFPTDNKTGFRLIYSNVNGICPGSRDTDLEALGRAAAGFQADGLCIVETNIDTRARDVKERCQWTLRKFWDRTKIAMSSSASGPITRQYLPGGTMTVVGQPWSNYTTAQAESSALGRWTEATIMGRNNKMVTIITAYRVVQNTIGRCGPDTAYMQQWTLLYQQGTAEPDPRQQILEDLERRVMELKIAGHEVIICMDANDTLQKQGVFTRWVRAVDMVDILVHRHGTMDEPATHERGSQRIDYILVTPGLVDYVTAAGILPFKALSNSDHRALFIDVELSKYLQGHMSSSETAYRREVQSNNPRVIQKYREHLEQWLNQSGIEAEIEEIQQALESGERQYDDQMAQQMDSIDDRITAARLEAERQCRKIARDPWSPQLREAMAIKVYWEAWVSEFRYNRDYSERRAQTGVTTKIKEITMEVAQKQCRQAQKAIKEIRAQASELRDQHLEECAAMAESTGKMSKAKGIHQLRQREQSRRIFGRLRRLMGKTHKGGLTHILVPGSEPDTWEAVTDKETIEREMIRQNKKHFSQADGTPFTTAPLVDLFGPYGTTEESRQLLAGEFDTDGMGLSDATKVLLHALKREAPSNAIDSWITPDDVRRGYKVWRESTSTSPSGVHLGHEKALFHYEDHRIDAPEGGWLSDRIWKIKAQLLNWGIQYGHVYDRWKTIVNTLLEKVPGKPMIHKLRVIHLIESDFNLMIGILWGRRLMAKAEELGALGDEQGGSRRDRKAQDVLVFKHMVYSIARMTRTSLGTFDNDAKSCYDRIVMVFASLTAQRLGMDPRACELFLKTLEQVVYKIKTHMGVSEQGYTTTSTQRIHGPGQGGRGSPAVWTVECCLAMACMYHRTEGAWFTDPHKRLVVQQNMTGFVDDTTHWLNNFLADLQGTASADGLLHKMEIMAQWWEELLYAMGGKLELEKCFYYATEWEFNVEGMPKVATTEDTAITIVDSETKQRVFIRHEASTVAHKTLGVMECPTGDYKEEKLRMLQKARQFAQRVNSAVVNNNEAQVWYRSVYVPSMAYSGAVSTFTERDASDIQGPATQAYVNALGYAGTTPQEIVYGPTHLGGIGLRHLFAEHGTQKVLMLIQQVRTGRSLGDLMVIALQWAQQVAGCSGGLLEEVDNPIPQLAEERWVETLREFLKVSELKLHLPELELPRKQREEDLVIMDHLDGLSVAEIQQVNRCRLYLRAVYVSDLCNALGTEMRDGIGECEEHARVATGELWPRQERPGGNHRRMWRLFLRRFFTENGRVNKNLGKWITRTPRHIGKAVFVPELQVVLSREDNSPTGWLEWQIGESMRRGVPLHRPTPWMGALDQEWIPADMITSRGQLCAQWGEYESGHDPLEMLDWQQFCKKLPAWEQAVMGYVKVLDQTALHAAFQDPEQKLWLVSNGTVCDENGAYAWLLGSATETFCEGIGTVRGGPVTSARAEAFGRLAGLLYLKRYIWFHRLQVRCAIKQYCANKVVIQNTQLGAGETTASGALRADYDVLATIWQVQEDLWQMVPRLRTGQHVKGHQDRQRGAQGPLTRQVELTTRANEVATEAIDLLGHEIWQEEIYLPGGRVYLISEGKVVASHERRTLLWKWAELRLQSYYTRKFKWAKTTVNTVNWAAFQGTRKRGMAMDRFGTKWLIGWLPTGDRLAKYGGIATQCMRCGLEENNEHIFLCGQVAQKNAEMVRQLDEYLRELGTIDDVRTGLCDGIRYWLQQHDGDHPAAQCEMMGPCVAQQQQIGWNNVLKGLMAVEWACHQEHRSTKGEMGDVWARKVTEYIAQVARERWRQRNDLVHRRETTVQLSWAEREVLAQIRMLYAYETQVSAHDRHVFAMPLAERESMPLRAKQVWVRRMKPIIERMVSTHVERTVRHNRDIRDMFRQQWHECGEDDDATTVTEAESEELSEMESTEHSGGTTIAGTQASNETENMVTDSQESRVKRMAQVITQAKQSVLGQRNKQRIEQQTNPQRTGNGSQNEAPQRQEGAVTTVEQRVARAVQHAINQGKRVGEKTMERIRNAMKGQKDVRAWWAQSRRAATPTVKMKGDGDDKNQNETGEVDESQNETGKVDESQNEMGEADESQNDTGEVDESQNDTGEVDESQNDTGEADILSRSASGVNHEQR